MYRLVAVVVLLVCSSSALTVRAQQASLDPGVVIVRTLDCRDGDPRRSETCVPLPNVLLVWDQKDTRQYRYTLDNGEDRLTLESESLLLIQLKRDAWTDEEMYPISESQYAHPVRGTTTTIEFLFLAWETITTEGRATFTARTYDCSATPSAPAASCPPLANAGLYRLLLYGVEGFDRLYTTDEDGYFHFEHYHPSMIYLYAPPFPECPDEEIDVALVPRVGEFRFVLLDGDEIEVDIAYVFADDLPPVATPTDGLIERTFPLIPKKKNCPTPRD